MGKKLKPIIGTQFGNYKVVSDEVFKIKDTSRNLYRGYFKVVCTLCDTEHLVRSDILNSKQATKCKACSNKEKYLTNVKNKVISFKGYSCKHQGTGDMSKSYLFRLKTSCKSRKIQWDDDYMTTSNMWELLLKQDSKCALTGLNITLSKGNNSPVSNKDNNLDYSGWNASLDRIDSSVGYTENNLQWVHRDINKMKNSFKQDYFLEMCNLIVKNKNGK